MNGMAHDSPAWFDLDSCAAHALDRVHREDRRVFLTVGVKMLSGAATGFDEHADHDPDNRESSATEVLYIVAVSRRRANQTLAPMTSTTLLDP